MTVQGQHPVSTLIQEARTGKLSRRAIVRRGTALGLSAPVLAALLRVAPAAAQDGTPPVAPSGDPVVFGCVYNLTGDYASIDNPAQDGSLLAAKELSAAGGVLGRPVELKIYDGKSDPTEISNVTRRLLDEDQVPVVVGLTDTSMVLPSAQLCQEAGIPFLDVGGTAPIITSVGDFVFMLPFGDNVQAAVAAEYAAAQGYATCAILKDNQSDYTRFLAQYFADRFDDEDLGGSIVSELDYASGDTDFSAQLTEFANLDPAPDFLFISSGPNEIGTIVAQVRDNGLTQPIVGGDGYDTPLLVELAGEAAEGVVFTTHEGIYGDSPLAAEFNVAYETEYGTPPPAVFSALGYDGVNLMADAINRAGSLDGAAIRDALAATSGFAGVTGTISYEPGVRIPNKSVALIQVQGGVFTLLSIGLPTVVPPA
jgi:branched-chain amino acid transport system substrate-binding protein